MEIVDEHVDEPEDGGPGMGPAAADGMQLPANAQGELAIGVDAVGAGPVVGVAGAVARAGFGADGIRGGGGGTRLLRSRG